MLYRQRKEIYRQDNLYCTIFSKYYYTGNTFPPIFVFLRSSAFIKR